MSRAAAPVDPYWLAHCEGFRVSDGGARLAFPVDEVHGTHHFNMEELTDLPVTVTKATATYTKAVLRWQKKSVGLLDDQLLFSALNRGLA